MTRLQILAWMPLIIVVALLINGLVAMLLWPEVAR
jgi:hypothetical protein